MRSRSLRRCAGAAVAHPSRAHADYSYEMERLVSLVVLVWWGAAGEPLSAALRRRSDGGVYAQRFARSYEPAVFVALPLHRPIPVLQLLSASAAPPEPPSAPTVYAASTSHATFAKPARPQGAETQSYHSKTKPRHYETTSTWYGNKQYSETSSWYRGPSAADTSPPTRYGQRLAARRPSPAPPQAPAASAWQEQLAPQEAPDFYESPIQVQQNAPVILYARPTQQGGYEYRKHPAKPPKKAVPIVIRIHKHRIIRDD